MAPIFRYSTNKVYNSLVEASRTGANCLQVVLIMPHQCRAPFAFKDRGRGRELAETLDQVWTTAENPVLLGSQSRRDICAMVLEKSTWFKADVKISGTIASKLFKTNVRLDNKDLM